MQIRITKVPLNQGDWLFHLTVIVLKATVLRPQVKDDPGLIEISELDFDRDAMTNAGYEFTVVSE